MKNKKINIVLCLSSFIYAIQFYINNKITPVGDQTAFLEYAKEFHYNYLFFGIDRYFTWSSRLLIESATLLFSVHEKLFIAAAFLATLLLVYALRKLTPSLPWLPALLIFIFLPATEFLSAGSIPTYVNYIFPASLLLFALFFRESKNIWINMASLLCFLVAIMQEQLAVYAFLWLLFETVLAKKDKKPLLGNLCYLALSALGIISAKLSPGNALRLEKNIVSWFPNFPNLNIFQKLGLGFLETGDNLLSTSFAFVMVFLLVLFVYALHKKNVMAIALSGFVLFNIVSQKMGWNTIFGTLTGISKAARESGTFSFNITYMSAVAFYGLLLLMILYALWLVISDCKEKIWLTYLFVIGFISRMVISLSPTLYASSTRTFLPLMISLFIITCRLLYHLYTEYQKRQEDVL